MKGNRLDEALRRAAFTYNAAADFYDALPLSFWNYFGARTVELLALRPGSNVLDVCCGAGASALPVARLVDPRGSVVGVDLAKELLVLARTKATQQQPCEHSVRVRRYAVSAISK